MAQEFTPGDILVFQLESGYGLMRVLAIDDTQKDTVWHVAAYRDLFLDVDSAESAVNSDGGLTVELPHAALTNRAFESTQVAKLTNLPLTDHDLEGFIQWQTSADPQIHDRSIRLLLGLR